MRKKIRYYPQHPLDPWNPTMETCGAACVLMLLDYYDMINHPTQKMEGIFYSHYRVNGYKGMTGAAVANCLSGPKEDLKKFLTDHEKALDVHLIQSFEEKMDNRGDLFSQEDYEKIVESHLMHLKKCRDRIQLTTGLDFDTEFLKQQLHDGKKLMLECFIPEVEDGPPSVLHWVILEKFDEQSGLFRVRDPNPRVKLFHHTEAELEGYMNTPVGKICIVVGEKD